MEKCKNNVNIYNANESLRVGYGSNLNEGLCYLIGRGEGCVGLNPLFPTVILRTRMPLMVINHPY